MKKYVVTASFVLAIAVGAGVYALWSRAAALKGETFGSARVKEIVASRQKRLADATAAWSTENYVPVRATPDFGELVRSLVSKQLTGSALTPEQISEGGKAVEAFFFGMSATEYSDYIQFRLPLQQYTVTPDRLVWTRERLRLSGVDRTVLTMEGEQLFSHFWKNQTKPGQSYLSAVALSTLRSGVSANSQSVSLADLHLISPDTKVVGRLTFFPYFLFDDQPDGTKGTTSDECLVISCLAKVQDGVLPVVYKAYWSRKYKRWLPHSVMLCAAFDRRSFPVF